jgi:hypothetical protein
MWTHIETYRINFTPKRTVSQRAACHEVEMTGKLFCFRGCNNDSVSDWRCGAEVGSANRAEKNLPEFKAHDKSI